MKIYFHNKSQIKIIDKVIIPKWDGFEVAILHDMKIGDTVEHTDLFTTYVVRVPSGWIYHIMDRYDHKKIMTSTFVPLIINNK